MATLYGSCELSIGPSVVRTRIVRVPSGPLLRVEGTEVTIPCNVSDYEGPKEQNFDWKFSSKSGGPHSRWDDSFTDSSYKARVTSGGIALQRVSNSQVLLRKQLATSDEGKYACTTRTDETFSGNYEDSVILKVISDTLMLRGVKGRLASARTVTVGGSFQLQCQASSTDSSEHTHLALTWERKAPADCTDVLTLSHLGRFQPGSGYEERYSSGKVRLDTTGGDGYRLTVGDARPSDAGEYSCVARIWVLGPEGWVKIQEKRVPVARVEVRPIGLSVNVPVSAVFVTHGDPLNLSCQVSHDSDGPVRTRVQWFQSSDPSAAPGETHEVLGGQDAEPEHEGASTHLLEVPHAWDAGDYSCKATIWSPMDNGTWYPAAEKMSDPIRVILNSSVPDFEVSLNASLLPQFSEEPTELVCQGSGLGAARLSVSWYFTPGAGDPASSARLVASLAQDWTLQVGEIYRQRLDRGELILSRRDPQTFVLRIQWTSEQDRGHYHCVGTAWELQRNASWAQSREVASRPINVFWTEEEILCGGSDITDISSDVIDKIMCDGTDTTDITSNVIDKVTCGVTDITSNAIDKVTCGVTDITSNAIDKVTCGVTDITSNVIDKVTCGVTDITSNAIDKVTCGVTDITSNAIDKVTCEATLMVNAVVTKPVAAAGGTFEMKCSVAARNIPSPRYSVRVTVARPLPQVGDPTPVLSLSHAGVTQREAGSAGHSVLEKIKEGVYLFRLSPVQTQDAGDYSCSVTAWTQGGGGAWREVQTQASNAVQLDFQTTGLVFNVTARSDSLSVSSGERAEFWCIVTVSGPVLDTEDMGFEVSWFAQRPGQSPTFLAAVDRSAQVRHSRRNSSSELALERVSDMEFRLRIYGCEEEDVGGHYCTVTPWVRSGEGGWNRQEGITSNTVLLNVQMDLLSAFKYPLLIGVGLALIVGLLSCLIGYCSSRFCCKVQPTQDTRKEHRRLMSMEMD
ncbi:LOW QUALITY PROTEIN: prostaglandin F2 receptor negative regulator [Rhinophrynus dorsalis]